MCIRDRQYTTAVVLYALAFVTATLLLFVFVVSAGLSTIQSNHEHTFTQQSVRLCMIQDTHLVFDMSPVGWIMLLVRFGSVDG